MDGPLRQRGVFTDDGVIRRNERARNNQREHRVGNVSVLCYVFSHSFTYSICENHSTRVFFVWSRPVFHNETGSGERAIRCDENKVQVFNCTNRHKERVR